jgi:hypothetical protein
MGYRLITALLIATAAAGESPSEVSVRPNLSQPVVAQSEMVGYFVPQDALDSCANLIYGAAAHFDRALVDADLVRQDEAIVMGPFGLGNAVVEAQQLGWMVYAGQPHRLGVGPVFHHHVHVVQPRAESLGQAVQAIRYKLFEGLAIHTGHIIPPSAHLGVVL